MRIATILLATISLAAGPAFAQTGAPAKAAPTPSAKPAPTAAAKPVPRPVASFWTSSEPTFDEGTYDRINGAMLSYAAIDVRGGWPQVAKVNLAPGATGPDVARLRQRLAITED